MIKVDIQYKGKGLDSIRIKGHANSGEYGKDIVCAGVSAVTFGALNAIDDDESFDISIEEGDIRIETKGALSEHDKTVLEILIIQLKTIEESYNGFIEIKERK